MVRLIRSLFAGVVGAVVPTILSLHLGVPIGWALALGFWWRVGYLVERRIIDGRD